MPCVHLFALLPAAFKEVERVRQDLNKMLTFQRVYEAQFVRLEWICVGWRWLGGRQKQILTSWGSTSDAC